MTTPGDHEQERVVIPPHCCKPKHFRERPSIEIINDIMKHIKAGKEPHEWWGHTHTRPPKVGRLEYLGEFQIPDSRKKVAKWAVCPCCTPDHRKYGRGMIGWFPDEGVIRLIGRDCFRSFNRESHDRALQELRATEQRRKDENFILSKAPRLKDVLDTAEHALDVAKAFDEFRSELKRELEKRNMPLWDHVKREGQLFVYERQSILRVGANGDEYIEYVEAPKVISSINGYNFIGNEKMLISKFLLRNINNLKMAMGNVNFSDNSGVVDTVERSRLIRVVTRCVSSIRDSISFIKENRKFATVLTINSLRTWGRHVGCPMRSDWRWDGNGFSFKSAGDVHYSQMTFPRNLHKTIYDIVF